MLYRMLMISTFSKTGCPGNLGKVYRAQGEERRWMLLATHLKFFLQQVFKSTVKIQVPEPALCESYHASLRLSYHSCHLTS